jgi:uncharacterized phage protein (TIGR02220 family)
VKLYTAILDADSDWLKMTDAECGVLAKMLALAARMNNAMPYNSEVITEEICASSPVNLDAFVERGLFEVFSSRAECVELEQVRVNDLGAASKKSSKSASKNAMLREERGEIQSSERTDLEKKNPPTPRKRVEVGGVREIVEYLNQVTGKSFSIDRGSKEVEGALKRGGTVQEAIEVIDYLWAKWRDDPKWVRFVDKTTPFRASNFDRYLDEARAGKANTSATGTKPKIVLSPENQRIIDDLKKIAGTYGG